MDIITMYGHLGEMKYLLAKAEQQECPESGCSAAARESSIVKGDELGTDMASAGGALKP
jgi:SpoVK/Ycf46/Vps4 family AAA+-type ATPase